MNNQLRTVCGTVTLLGTMMMAVMEPQVATSNPHHSSLAWTDPVERTGLLVFILGPFSPLGAGCGIERSCPSSTVSIFLSPGEGVMHLAHQSAAGGLPQLGACLPARSPASGSGSCRKVKLLRCSRRSWGSMGSSPSQCPGGCLGLRSRMTFGKSLSHHQPHHFGVYMPCSYPSSHLTLTTTLGVGQSPTSFPLYRGGS